MTTPTTTTVRKDPLYSAVIGLAGLTVLLQAVWAGVFIREHKDYPHAWIEVHARGADVAILLAAAATVIAFLRLRERRELWIGAGVLTVLLLVEAYIGGIVGPHPGWSIVHFPLAMALFGLSVYLPLRATRG